MLHPIEIKFLGPEDQIVQTTAGNSSARLGCQCIVNGPIVIRPLEG